jgi:hypothetical protein
LLPFRSYGCTDLDKAKEQSISNSFDDYIRALELIAEKKIEPNSKPGTKPGENFNEIIDIVEQGEKAALTKNKENYLKLRADLAQSSRVRDRNIQLAKFVTGTSLLFQMVLLIF